MLIPENFSPWNIPAIPMYNMIHILDTAQRYKHLYRNTIQHNSVAT